MNYLNKSHQLHHEILSFVKYCNLSQDSNDLVDLLRQHESHLIHLNPLKWKSSNPSDRQMIQSGKITQYPNLELNDDQKKAILEFSDEFDLNEIDCLSLWIEISDPIKRRLLESQLGRSYGSFDEDLPRAARELFSFQQDCDLNIVIELMKARYDTALIPSKRAIIMRETNRLLCGGIALNIMENLLSNIRQGGHNLLKLVRQQGGDTKFQSQRTQKSWKQVHLRLMQLSECLFYIFYQTQIESKENNKLLELIEGLSELVVLKEHSPLITDTEHSTSTSIPGEWSNSLFQVLIVLQLTHVCAMEQVQTLYCRTNDTEPYLLESVGNEILPEVGGYDGMEKERWKNGMAQGFTCLVFAILREPYVDMRDPSYSPEEVFWLLDQASQLQAYSYIRLCMLPVLQSFSLTANETSTHSLYMSVLCNFVHNLLTVFCLPVYDHLGFPFPDSKLTHTQDVQWLIQEYEKQEQNLLLNGDDVDYTPIVPPLEYFGFSKLLQRDCLDDVLDMLSAVLLANPNYPPAFWVPGKYHPFTQRALQGVTTDSSLILPCLNFLTALSSGLNSGTCEAVYHFLNQKLTGFFDWNRFFTLIRQYAEDLGGNTTQVTLSGVDSSQASVLSQEDSEVLEGIVNLIGAVMKHPAVTQAVVSDSFDPIGILFSLFVCRIDYTLKGSILRTISAICASTSVSYHMSLRLGSGTSTDSHHSPDPLNSSIGGKIIEQIWTSIEFYRLLPFSGTSQKEPGGLVYELESVETVSGNYPVTDGFLTLLLTLLQHEYGIPVNLGYGYRIPGVVCYVDYLVSEILLKMHLRSYSSDGHGQLWKILSQVILILTSIIQSYPVNAITVADLIQAKSSINKSSSQESKVLSSDAGNAPSSLFQNKAQLHQSLLEDFMDLDGFFPMETSQNRNSQSDARSFSSARSSTQYLKRQVNAIQKIPKPKSAGFAVLCHLLHNSRRVFDHLIQILKQNSPDSLLSSRETEIQRKCQISVEILKGIISEGEKLSQIKDTKEKKKLSQQRDQRWSYEQKRGGRETRSDYEEMIEINTDIELPKYGWDEFAYDIPYWKYRTISAIIGLLYEVSLREKTFLTCVRIASSSSPLTILRTERVNEPPILISVQLTELSHLMTGVLNGQPLTDITNFITLLPESLITYPSVPVMAVRILQYVSTSQIPSKILNTLYNSSNGDRIISSCTQALVTGNDGLVVSFTNPYAYATRRYGGGANDFVQSLGLIFTPSQSYTSTCGLASYSYYFSALRSQPVQDSYLSNIFKENNDVREAILDLLLLTFSANKSCLCHYLLGLLDSVDSVLGGTHSIEYRTSLTSFISRGFHMRPGFPGNCLDAIIDLISSGVPGNPLGQSILSLNPTQGLKCYELLYRLCASKLTNNTIMKILWMRRESPKYTHFFQPHLERFLNHYLTPSSSMQKRDPGESVAADTARFNSCAWILKMIALELHSIELSPKEVVPQSAVQAILNLFFDPDSRANQNTNIFSQTTSSSFAHSAPKSNQNIMLLKILNVLPLSSLSDQLEGYDSPVGVQCMKKCSESYRVTYGGMSSEARNEPPGQFSYINIQSLIELLQEVFSQPSPGIVASGKSSVPSSASGAYFDQQIEATVSVAINYNKYNMLIASLANLFQGWRQLVDVSLLGCGSLLIGQFDSEWNGLERSRLSIHDTNASITVAIDKLINFLMLPVINLLISQPSLEMILTEQLARSLLSMTALLRDVCSNSSESDADSSFFQESSETSILTPSLHELILKGILQAIIRRGTSQVSRTSSSLTYRGYLYTCVVHLLRCAKVNSPTASGSEIFLSSTPQSKEFRARCLALMEPYAVDFIDIAAADAAIDSSKDLVSRISAFSALGSVLSIIGPSADNSDAFESSVPTFKKSQQYRDSHYGSSIFLQALYLLRDRGHLKRILLSVGLTDKSLSTASDAAPGLLEATLTLCTHIASCRDGSNILLEYGVLNGINSLPVIPLPSNRSHSEEAQEFSIDTADVGRGSMALHTEEDIEVMLEPILRLLNILGASSPCHEVLQQCCVFLLHNHSIVSYFLHLHSPTLRGLRIIYSLVSVMCLIAPATSAVQPSDQNQATSSLLASIWETEMGPKGDVYTANLCRLARVLGSKPLPSWNYISRSRGTLSHKDSRLSWWAAVKPSSPYEERLNEDTISLPNCLKLNGNVDHPSRWTRFDGLKFIYGLRILERIASFFRMRSSLCVTNSSGIRRPSSQSFRQNQSLFSSLAEESYDVSRSSWVNDQSAVSIGDAIGLLAINMEDLTFTFSSLASFYFTISSLFLSKDEENSRWLMESNTLSSPFYPVMKKRGGGGDAQASQENLHKASGKNERGQMSEVDQEINRLLLYTSESLLCTLYDLIIASPNEKASWRNDVAVCLQITEKFPPHSFIRQISRSINGQINDLVTRK